MRMPNPSALAQMSLLLGVSLLSVACGGSSSTTPVLSSTEACTALEGKEIPASEIGLPTTGATVVSAQLVAASAAGNANAVEFCRVLGSIHPVDINAGTSDIQFQVDLPTNWNEKTLQMGGGGTDGSIPDVEGPFVQQPTIMNAAVGATAVKNPLAQGYVTLGSDSGHEASGPFVNTFALNEEELANFGRLQIKKTHDAAMAIIKALYGKAPKRNYFAGGSQGGHESLIAAQFYPQDYDGVVAGFPAYDVTLMHLGANYQVKALYGDHAEFASPAPGGISSCTPGAGWLSPAKMYTLQYNIINACGGAADGFVSDPTTDTCTAATAKFLLKTTENPLRCAGGADTGSTCLSDAQIDTVNLLNSRFALPSGIYMNGGKTSYAKWALLDGAWTFASYTDSPTDNAAKYDAAHNADGSPKFGPNGPIQDTSASMTAMEGFGNTASISDQPFQDAFQYMVQKGTLRYIITQDLTFGPAASLAFNPSDYAARIMKVSSMLDTSSANYDDFRAKGGKILHFAGAADTSITPYNSIDLFDNMASTNTASFPDLPNGTMGSYSLDSSGTYGGFYSFYLIPGFNHGYGTFNAKVDWLGKLDAWVTQGTAPTAAITASDEQQANPSVPTTAARTRPVCQYPYYAKYTGTDRNLASSYTCTKLAHPFMPGLGVN